VLTGREVVAAAVVVLASGTGDTGDEGAVMSAGGSCVLGVVVIKGEVEGVVLANAEDDSSSDVLPGGEKAGVVLVAVSAEAKIGLAGVVVTAGNTEDVPPKTVDPVPLPNVASPPVFHAGTELGVLGAVWPNVDGPPDANAPNPLPPLETGAPGFVVSGGFEALNVAVPPDANAPNGPPLPNVEGDVVLTGVTIGVVDMGVPSPVLLNPD
jgi:hypothetical protein